MNVKVTEVKQGDIIDGWGKVTTVSERGGWVTIYTLSNIKSFQKDAEVNVLGNEAIK